jgi:hypothetical protein
MAATTLPRPLASSPARTHAAGILEKAYELEREVVELEREAAAPVTRSIPCTGESPRRSPSSPPSG